MSKTAYCKFRLVVSMYYKEKLLSASYPLLKTQRLTVLLCCLGKITLIASETDPKNETTTRNESPSIHIVCWACPFLEQ